MIVTWEIKKLWLACSHPWQLIHCLKSFFHCVEALGAVILDISRQAITLWLVCWVDAALDGKSSESDRPVIRIPNH